MSHYGGEAGPAATYLPLLAAWRSGRITTKKRDYVLAVFPDVRGYVAPPNTRKLSFTELLANALGQDPIKQHCHVVRVQLQVEETQLRKRDAIGDTVGPGFDIVSMGENGRRIL